MNTLPAASKLPTVAVLALITLLNLGAPALAAPAADSVGVYFGTYTGRASKGIYYARLSLSDGKLSQPSLAAESKNPAFLAIHPNRRFLYSVGETDQGGGVVAWAIDPESGKLGFINHRSSGGAGPTHLVVDRAGKNVLVANYSGGSIACLPIEKDGSLRSYSSFVQHTGSSVNPNRQKSPHAHGIYTDAANRFVFVPDLGLDQVKVYRFDEDRGLLTAHSPAAATVAPGAGPRHFAFESKGRFGFVINEMVCTMTTFRYNRQAGVLSEVGTVSTLPPGVSVAPGFSTAEVFAHPNGRFLYGSNRGHDSIAVFSIGSKGSLTWLENEPSLAKVPRGFGIDPTGRYLIAGGQNSDDAFVFRIDPKTGLLSPTGQSVSVGAPVCIEFVPLR